MRFAFIMLCALICAQCSGWCCQRGSGSIRLVLQRRDWSCTEFGHGPRGVESGHRVLSDGPLFRCRSRPALSGYRWRYAIDADAGTGFEVTFGRALGPLRLEISASQSKNNIEQEFVSLEYLDGSPWTGREGVVSNDVASIGDLTTRIVALNVYRDFSAPHRALTRTSALG